MGKQLGAVLQKARKSVPRRTQGDVAVAMGVTRSAVGQWESGRTAPASETLISLCAYLGIDLAKAGAGVLEWVNKTSDKPNDSPIINHPPKVGGRGTTSEIRPSSVEIQHTAAMPVDVEVRGIAVGGNDGYFLFNGEIIDYVRRPAGIAKARDVFAIYVAGSSMSPRYEDGDLVYLATGRNPKIGDYIVVELSSGEHESPRAFIKRLVKRTAGALTLEQFTPPLEFDVPVSDIKATYRVIPWGELLGV